MYSKQPTTACLCLRRCLLQAVTAVGSPFMTTPTWQMTLSCCSCSRMCRAFRSWQTAMQLRQHTTRHSKPGQAGDARWLCVQRSSAGEAQHVGIAKDAPIFPSRLTPPLPCFCCTAVFTAAVLSHNNSGLRPQSGTTAASAATADLASLWYALAIPHLGQIVEPGPAFVQPPEPQPARQLSVCLAAALPLLQRHLCSILAAAEYQVRVVLVVWPCCGG